MACTPEYFAHLHRTSRWRRNPAMKMQGKTAVVTGASGGIGRSIVEQLSQKGAMLILVGRDETKLNKLVNDLGGDPHVGIVADLGTSDGRGRLRDYCETAVPDGIDLLINGAGVSDFGLFEEQSQSAVEHLISVNLISPMLVCQDLLPSLQHKGLSQIVNIGSTFGAIGYPGFSSYCASKFGIRGFTESLRRELAGSGIQVSYVAPRATQTALNSKAIVAMNKELGTAMDQPSAVANEVMRVISKRAALDCYLGWPEKLFVRINALLPALVDSSLRKQLPTIRRFAKH